MIGDSSLLRIPRGRSPPGCLWLLDEPELRMAKTCDPGIERTGRVTVQKYGTPDTALQQV